MKILINNEEVLCDKNIKITEEMLNTSSTILNNVYPKAWETTHDYTQYFYPKDYSQCLIWTDKLRNASINGKSTQNGTPTPDYPVEIESELKIVVGDNILPQDEYIGSTTTNGITYTNNGDGTFNLSGTATANTTIRIIPIGIFTLEAGQPYYLYSSQAYNSNTFNMSIAMTDNGTNKWLTVNNTLTPTTIPTNVRLQFYIASGNTVNTQNVKLMLVKGNVAPSEYEPYKTKNYQLNLGDIELNGINGYNDMIYNVGENWYLYKIIQKTVITEDNKTIITAYGTNNNHKKVDILKSDLGYSGGNYTTGITLINKYREITATANIDSGCFGTNLTTNYLRIWDDSFTDLTTARNNMIGTVIYMVKTAPTITQITDTTLLNQLNVLIKDLLFSGVAKRTGNISLNPFHPHYCDLQILDYKTLLSEGDMLDFVIADKTVEEAIEMVINAVSGYGFTKGNIDLPDNFKMGTYNTQEKTAYDVFQYIADITQTKWTTRVLNENTVAIDFYNPYDKTPVGTIDSTKQYFKDNNIVDITYSYSTEDYRNKQVMTSKEVVSSISETYVLTADGVNSIYDLGSPIGELGLVWYISGGNFVICSVVTKAEQEQGYAGDVIYKPGETTVQFDDVLAKGTLITLEVSFLVPGRQIALNEQEINRIATQNSRNGIISRYENRDDTTSSIELQRIAQSYIEYKGKAEITLTVQTHNTKLCNIGDIMLYNSSLPDLNDTYMCKKVDTEMIMTTGDIFYTYEFTNTYNTENAINYFDNQRNKTLGNIADGDTITRNLDIENRVNIVFFDTEVS